MRLRVAVREAGAQAPPAGSPALRRDARGGCYPARMSVSTKPPSGMRDFLPAAVRRREAVIRVIREVYEAHGFEPLETPAMERLDVLLGKYGEEGDGLIFPVAKREEAFRRGLMTLMAKLKDVLLDLDVPAQLDAKGADDVTKSQTVTSVAMTIAALGASELHDLGLRYDLTVPLARVVAEHQADLPRVFKRFQIQPVWRADRPQRGRFREFFQCDLDVVGSASRTVEVEVASAGAAALQRLGFTDFRIRTNHRGVLAGIVEAAGVDASREREVFVAIDKLDKVGRDGVLSELAGRGIAASSVERIGAVLDPVAGGNDAEVARLRAVLAGSARGLEALDDLVGFLRLAEGSPAAAHLALDPSLARGLDYYTGPIFEVAVADLAGSIGSGGRYDDLVGMFLGRKVPACGFSLGLERILVVMEERAMFGAERVAADVVVAQFDASLAPHALALARELRSAGLRVDLHCDADKLGRQFKDADARGIACVALVGPEEAARGTVSMKHLKSGERTEVPRADAAAWVRAQAGR